VDASTLPDDLSQRLDAWLATSLERAEPLAFSDIRKGVRSLSALYVEGRGRGNIAPRSVEGAARRAALSTYYGVLHFLTAHHAAACLAPGALGQPAELVDLGCGGGAAGAGVATALSTLPRVLGFDRSGWAIGEARRTYAAFGLRGRTRRGRLPQGLPRLAEGQLAVLGWVANELTAEERNRLLTEIERGLDRGAQLMLLEPLSGRVSPWWETVSTRLGARGVESALVKASLPLPDWIQRMDRAAGLDHRELGARVLSGPVR